MKRITIAVLLVLAAGMALASTAAKDLYIPAVARSTGAFGTFWSSDLRLYNPTTATVTATVTYLPSAAYAGDAGWTTVSISALETKLIENVLENALGITTNTAGALHITAPVDIYAESRTFTVQPSSRVNDTYGQRIPGIPASQAVAAGESVDVIYIDNDAEFRTNFGIVDAGGAGVAYTLTAYGHDGSVLGTPYSGTVGANQWDQFNPLDKVGAGTQSNARVMFTVTSGKAMPYASQVDNASGDPIFIDGTKIKASGGGTTSGCGTGMLYGFAMQINSDWEGWMHHGWIWAIDDFNLYAWQDPTPEDPNNEDDFPSVYASPQNSVFALGYSYVASDPSEYVSLADGEAFDFSIEFEYGDGTKTVMTAIWHIAGIFSCPNYVEGNMDALVKATDPSYKDWAGKWYWRFYAGMK